MFVAYSYFDNLIKKQYKITIFAIVITLHLASIFKFGFLSQNNLNFVDSSVIQMVNLQTPKKQKQPIIENKEKNLITNKNSKKEINLDQQPEIIEELVENNLEEETLNDGDDKINYKISGQVDYKIGTVNNPAPPYPRLAVRRSQQGRVEICAEVKNNGYTNKAHICSSSGYRSLDNVALETIKKWKFEIKAQKFKPLYFVKVPILFSLS